MRELNLRDMAGAEPRKCLAVAFLTRNWGFVKLTHKAFMADRTLIETAIVRYEANTKSS